jgi:hypothetical protein
MAKGLVRASGLCSRRGDALFVLRNAQVEAFRASLMSDFERRAMDDLRSSFPDKLAGSSDDDIRTLIRSGLEKARSYEVVNEADITRYFEYMVEYGVDFDIAPTSAWAAPILTSQLMTGHMKMNGLDDLTTFELRLVPRDSPGEKATKS